ncbi:MAG: U32 family peptidase [Clostridia bacterium]|nr:U32 family peptidase [Clostridia bacterium]
MQKRPELLAPAGNFEKLKAAVLYGADAVYLAGNAFGMRAAADNFTNEEIVAAAEYAHSHGVKVYVTVNTMPRTAEYAALEEYLVFLSESGVDAVIISDLGVLSLCKRVAPNLEIHISTQASSVSTYDVLAWRELGAKRVVLARELTMNEVAEICKNKPEDTDIECFVHGAMCVSYSGRCLLSNYYTGRDSNRGACAQPCRWNYRTLEIYEEKRPEQPLGLYEDKDGTFIMSSRDMCMIKHIPELIESGITSFKIEGRMKSAYYAAVVTNAYRMAIDAYLADPENYKFDPLWLEELCSVSHRDYATGYWFDRPSENAQTCENMGYIREKAYIATALAYDKESGLATFIQRNKVSRGEKVELISPAKTGRGFVAEEIFNEKGEEIESAPHPAMIFKVRVPFEVKEGDIMRGAN